MSRIYGVVTGTVTKIDPEGLGRVKFSFNWGDQTAESNWAPVATLMSGNRRGVWFMPEVGDEVLAAFNQGDVNFPFVVGFLWNGQQRPPKLEPHAAGPNPQVRLIGSVNGHRIALYDPVIAQGDKGFIRIEDGHDNMIELSNASITIRCAGTIVIDAPNVIINNRLVSGTPSSM